MEAKLLQVCSDKNCPYCKGTGRIRVENNTTNNVAYYQCFGETIAAMPFDEVERLESLLNNDTSV